MRLSTLSGCQDKHKAKVVGIVVTKAVPDYHHTEEGRCQQPLVDTHDLPKSLDDIAKLSNLSFWLIW